MAKSSLSVAIWTGIACGLSLLVPTTASAYDCATYGKISLKQFQENKQRNCKFAGPEWSPNLKAHISWCSTVGPDIWKAEIQKRAEMLKSCSG